MYGFRHFLYRFCLLTVLTVAAGSTVFAQFWTRQPYTEWSARDCQRLLTNSPWARQYVIDRVIIQPFEQEAAVTGRVAQPRITYTVQVLSALPIRQALVRQARLDPRVEQLPEEARSALQARQDALLGHDYGDTIVIRVLYATNASTYDREIARLWQTSNMEALKQDVFLIGSGGKVHPVEINVGGGTTREIILVFPRTEDSRPIVTSSDRTLAVEFQHPAIGVLGAERIFVEFRVRDMVVNGELVL